MGRTALLLIAVALSACSFQQSKLSYAPGAPGFKDIDHLAIGHYLMATGDYEDALKSYNRAVIAQGRSAEILAALGHANLALGRLGQAEKPLRQSLEIRPKVPEVMNNLAVVLMETGRAGEAVRLLEAAFALDSGKSDLIRNNLAKALAIEEESQYSVSETTGPQLVVRGTGDVLLQTR